MKLGGKRGEGYGKSWRGNVEGRLDQNTIYACVKFSNHKLKIRKEKVYCNLITVCTYSMSKLLAYNFFYWSLLSCVKYSDAFYGWSTNSSRRQLEPVLEQQLFS